MRVSSRESLEDGRDQLTVVPDTIDDLWHLQYIVEPGDHVAGDTDRRIQRNDEDLRDTGGQREHLWVKLRVETVEFHRFSNRLRIGGEIVECSREDQLGFSHTLNIEIHDEVTIEKRLKPDQEDRLSDAVAATQDPEIVIATIEEGAASVHEITQAGPIERTTLTGPSGKGEYARERSELFANLTDVLERSDADQLILAGPGFTKQDALQYIKDRDATLAERIRTVNTSSAGARGVEEVLSRDVLDKVRTAARVGEESDLIDELMKRIATDEPATYGFDAVEQAASYGAVETLLVLDDRLREERSPSGTWSGDIDEVIQQIEHQGGEIVVVSSENEPGERLGNLGGIAALLRYRIE